jgi:hypothetical protein
MTFVFLPEALSPYQAWLAVILLLILFLEASRFFVEVLR